MAYESHDFYCINCGKKGIPIGRSKGFLRGRFHRKKLYCPYCKRDINHVEIKSLEEKNLFLEMFNNGEFKDEAKESLDYGGASWMREDNLGTKQNKRK